MSAPSAPYLPLCSPISASFAEPPPEYTDIPPADNTPQVRMNEETHVTVETGDLVESKMRKICKMMCVTTNSALMVILWTIASMFFSGLSAYWLFATLPGVRVYDFLIRSFYPMSAVLVVVLLLSPVFAVAGDVRCGNFRLLLSGVIPLNVFGLVVLIVLTLTYVFLEEDIISYFLAAGYLLLLLAGGIFQVNVIQLGRDVLGDFNSPERSAFVHWYYWATYVPIFSFTVLSSTIYADSGVALEVLSIVLGLVMIVLLIFLLVTCVVHCVYLKIRGWNAVLPRIMRNPVAQILRVTRYALRSQPNPGHCGCWVRFSKIRQSNGGPADDKEVDNVTNFWVLVLLMVSLYGFFFWDDMWAAPIASLIINSDSSILVYLSSQVTTSVIVFISIPVYQFVIRPLLGKRSPPLLWRILAGLILQLISLVIVSWNVGATIKSSSNVLSNACNLITKEDVSDDTYDGESFGWFVLAIPQGINGISQLLVFPAVIELILTNAPRVMQGLLIGLWYAMQSIHVVVAIIETATCAVFYWQYYIMKIVLVLVSCITFGIVAFVYKRSQMVCDGHVAQTQGEFGIYRQLNEVDTAENI